mmetsp:Transcript_12260/g.27036  ORF Transcript_12260/g.27036 Transcript_12260/m.27036 type:complete len:379 (+) Transcript_12260:224-1360(+)
MDTKIEDSNLAHIGSAEDKAAREKAAKLEVNWVGAGEKVGIQIWRVENKRDDAGNPDFGINKWPEAKYGEFFNGDSYIVLHTAKDEEDSEKLVYDIYFWIGSASSQDEYGVAAYKANELDDLLGDAPIQHREVEGIESEEFMALFPKGIKYLDGGIESGFRHVEADSSEKIEIPTRLFHVHKQGRVTRSRQVPVSYKSLNDGDAFLLDTGNVVYTWFGETASPFEKEKTASTAHNLVDSRGGHAKSEIDVGMDNDDFWAALGGKGPIASAESAESVYKQKSSVEEPKMYRVREEDSHMKISEVEAAKKSLDTDDVFLLDTGSILYIWVGKDANKREKQQAMVLVQTHLKNFGREQTTQVSRVLEGQEKRVKGFAAACA